MQALLMEIAPISLTECFGYRLVFAPCSWFRCCRRTVYVLAIMAYVWYTMVANQGTGWNVCID